MTVLVRMRPAPPDGNTAGAGRVRAGRTAHPEAPPASANGAETSREDPARLQQLIEENTPNLARLVREREPDYNDLLRERISWREFYTPLGALFAQHLKELMRERNAPTRMRAWDGTLP